MGRKMIYNVKENANEYFNEYYHKTNRPYQCECGSVITYNTRYHHLKTKKHLQLINYINTIKEKEMIIQCIVSPESNV